MVCGVVARTVDTVASTWRLRSKVDAARVDSLLAAASQGGVGGGTRVGTGTAGARSWIELEAAAPDGLVHEETRLYVT